ncbi:MAG: hypothetical protein JXN59_01265 [Anaerolineae bacterium]|nr:hypothetical protein [Anaerolineae bacterium]
MANIFDTHTPQNALRQIMESAEALGVEIDEEKALQWLTAIAAMDHSSGEISVDESSGVFGHRVVLLDFDPADLERLRRVATIVELEDQPGVETAIALSGSAAQSHVQTFPGDFDYFERVNIKALSAEEAQHILGCVIREKALQSSVGPGYQLIEVRFGTLRDTIIRNDDTLKPGASITWSPAEIEDGHFDALTEDGSPITIDWDYASKEPGWCKLDWVLVDPGQPRAVKASNMLDATWEDPQGSIHPLDGFIDPYYQEVYLQAESIPLFSKIAKQMDPDALPQYVRQLEKEIVKYTQERGANYGKAAKRLYNVFRLTGRFEEAAFIRELFDEPAALLYQVSALLDGLADLGSGDSSISRETLRLQIDDLIRDISTVAEGAVGTGLIMSLLRLRDHVTGLDNLDSEWEGTLREMQGALNKTVDQYFEERLRALPGIAAYLDDLV